MFAVRGKYWSLCCYGGQARWGGPHSPWGNLGRLDKGEDTKKVSNPCYMEKACRDTQADGTAFEKAWSMEGCCDIRLRYPVAAAAV